MDCRSQGTNQDIYSSRVACYMYIHEHNIVSKETNGVCNSVSFTTQKAAIAIDHAPFMDIRVISLCMNDHVLERVL